MTLSTTIKTTIAFLAVAFVISLTAGQASAQVFGSKSFGSPSAGSWVDLSRGRAGAGASANGMFQIAKSRSSSKNGVQFGHGFGLGAGPNGIAISNSIGAGAGPGGVAHNMNLNIGRGGAHLSHSGVVSQGGNRRVVSGGHTGTTSNGRVYGGSTSSGYGNHTKAYSKSKTRNWGGGSSSPYRTFGTRSGGIFRSR